MYRLFARLAIPRMKRISGVSRVNSLLLLIVEARVCGNHSREHDRLESRDLARERQRLAHQL